MTSFADSLAPESWRLGFMVLPVLSPEMAPPSFARAQLRVKSTPAPATVAKHLVALGAPARLGGGEAALSRWSTETAGDPVDAVSAALAAIAPAVDALDAATVDALRTATFVPVAGGAAMEAPSRLFLRGRAALAPLAYEAPAKLADRASILRTLGAKDDVSPEDAAEVLRAAMRRANGRALGPNEIRAAVAAAREAVGDADDEGRRGTSSSSVSASVGSIPVPDAFGVLAPSTSLLHAWDAPASLLARVDKRKLRLTHPLAPASACVALGIRGVADAVRERRFLTDAERATNSNAPPRRRRLFASATTTIRIETGIGI